MGDQKQPANDDRIQTGGRKANAARPLDASDNEQGAERYPQVRQDDGIEAPHEERAFHRNPEPPQGAGDTSNPRTSPNEGRLGPAGDPAEGKP